MKPTGKSDRRVIRTRKAIMNAFNKLIVDKNISKITVSAIAREADIDRKTFYLHYDSITDLINYKTEYELERLLRALKVNGEGKSPLERVHIVLMEVNHMLTEELEVYQNIASSLSVEQILKNFERAMPPALEHENIDAPHIQDREYRMKLQFYIAGALSLYSSWLQSDHSTPIDEVSATIENAIAATAFPASYSITSAVPA